MSAVYQQECGRGRGGAKICWRVNVIFIAAAAKGEGLCSGVGRGRGGGDAEE